MQNKKQVYMILTNGFDPDIRVYKEAKYLVKKGFDVTILCWDRKCEYKDKQDDVLDNIKIKRFHILSKPGTGMKQLFPYMKFIRKVRKYLKNKEYKYLHCHDFDGILTGMLTKKKKDKKIIFDMHEIYNNYAYTKNIFFSKIFKYVIKKSDSIIYVNDEQIKNIDKDDKLIYLPNYPELETYKPVNKTQSDVIRINYIGSLRDYKSLKSLAEIHNNIENIKVGFFGMGVCYEQLKKEYSSQAINIYGKYDGAKESGRIYRDTDILYCAYDPNVQNWKNAYPVKLYEAVITLTPIIVTENTVAGKFVEENKIGEVIKYCNEKSIVQAIEKIKQNYTEYTKNLEKITNNYEWNNIAKNLEKIYYGG